MRLIDADSIVLDYSGLAKISPYDFQGIAEYFLKQIKRLPTVDAVPVVRCKDCEHFMEFEKPLGKWQGLCHYYNAHSVMKNDFCSRGKQK